MKIQWLGHSCFFITTDNGTRIMLDPCDAATGYAIKPRECDILTISHEHHDHNCAELAAGQPIRIDKCGEYEAHGVKITGISTYHDDVQGAKRGKNIIFIIEADGLRIAHLGDLGERLSDAAAARIGQTDVMLMPIGGVYTIDAQGASELMRRLEPKMIIPMHYKTAALSFELGTLEQFTALLPERRIIRAGGSQVRLDKEKICSGSILLPDYAQ